ncbi:MAG: hypothetical protein ABFD08_00190 [Syntrophomonas sp.]
MNKKKVVVMSLMLIVLSLGNMACSKTNNQPAPTTSSQENQQQATGENLNQNKQQAANLADNPAAEEMLFTNNNIYGVKSNPTQPTVFTLSQPCKITFIWNYHYFNKGALPGTIALKHQDGTVYGPWQTEGKEGQGKVANAYWIAKPNIVIKAGTYTVIDSNPATWSHNEQSKNCGFTEIKGIKQ